MKKIIVLSLFLVLTLVFLTACGIVSKSDLIEETVIPYLENKYGKDKDFKIDQTTGGGGTGFGPTWVWCTSNELPQGARFLVNVDFEKDSENKRIVIIENDNYIDVKTVISYLENKYGKDKNFKIDYSNGTGFGSGKVSCTSSELQGATFIVNVDFENERIVTVKSDNYIDIKNGN